MDGNVVRTLAIVVVAVVVGMMVYDKVLKGYLVKA